MNDNEKRPLIRSSVWKLAGLIVFVWIVAIIMLQIAVPE